MDPLTVGAFCLHNGFTMLRRFDLSFAEATGKMPARLANHVRFTAARKEGAGKNGEGGQGETGTITRTRTKTKRPNLYRVLLLNDDYTPMEFVVLVLQDVFNKPREEAMAIMLHVHQKGVGECGVFPYEVAETKVTRVMDSARKNQHPLQCVMEKQ
jgi:ATP-dependent Clp protease adaptor protein ClpS